MKIDFAKLRTAAEHAGNTFESGLNVILHVVEALAPLAEVAGAVTANPEITVAAKLAETGAAALDASLNQGKQPDAATVATLTAQTREVLASTPKQAG
jgi:hypothetical protein